MPRAGAGGAPATSARKVHRSRLTNRDDFDLTGILELGLDTACDLLGQGPHSHVVDVVGSHDHPNLPTGLNREDFLDALVARGDLLETLEPFHVGLECLTAGARSRSGYRVGRLDENGDFTLVRHVVMVCR